MKIGDLVSLQYNKSSIGMIVDERVLARVDGFDFMYKVLWQDGNSHLHEWTALKVINEDR